MFVILFNVLLKESNKIVIGDKDRGRRRFQKLIRVKNGKSEIRAFSSMFNFLYLWNIIFSRY